MQPVNGLLKNQNCILQNKKQNNTEENSVIKSSDVPYSKLPDADTWKAFTGISSKKSSNKLINKFALQGKLGINDIKNLKKIIKQGSSQSENISKLLTLVDSKTVNPKTLKYVCENGIMSDGMEKDINMIVNAKSQGIADAYIPNVKSKEEGVATVQTGDMFEVAEEPNVYIKNRFGKAEQLKMDKETMIKLFPPAERFANAQTYSADCYFVSTVNSMMDNPNARPYFLQCFEQDGKDIKIKFPSSDFVYTAKNGEMPKTYKGNFVTGSAGMKLIEYAYGEFLTDMVAKKVQNHQTKAISELQSKLSQSANEQENKIILEKIKNHQNVLDRFNNDLTEKKQELVVYLDNFRNPQTNENEGVNLRSLDQMNMYRKTSYQTPGDFYRGDGGYMEDVFIDFGYQETKAYSMDDTEIETILKNPELSEQYIFSGGTKNEGKRNLFRAELIMDRSLNMYGSHAYRVSPSKDDEGNVVFKVSNPWNSSHNSILTFEQMKQFFSEIHVAKIQ